MVRKYVAFIMMVLVTIAPSLASAQFSGPIVPPECNGLGGCPSICSFAQLLQNLLNVVIVLFAFGAVIILLLVGGKFIIARGNPAKITGAKKSLGKWLVSFIILLTAYMIVDLFIGALTGQTGIHWNRIC